VDQPALSGDGFHEVEGKIRAERVQAADQTREIQRNRHDHRFVTLLGQGAGNHAGLNQDILLIAAGPVGHFAVQDNRPHRSFRPSGKNCDSPTHPARILFNAERTISSMS